MADDRNNPNTGNEGGVSRETPGRNPNEGQSTSQRGEQGNKDQGLGKGEQGNRERNEQGFEKGGQQGDGQRGQNL